MIMRGARRLGKFVPLPFSARCNSESSVAVATNHPPKQSKKTTKEIKGGEEKSKMNTKNQTISKASLSEGLHRLIRRFKSFSQIFVYKEEEMEHMEKEMEIGFPTDVKHVTHIGFDGSRSVNWEKIKAKEILTFSSSMSSLQQFELAMATQSRAPLGLN